MSRRVARLDRLPAKLAVSVGSLLATVLLLEAVLGVAQINSRANVRFIPGKGTTYVPNAYYVHKKEGFSRGRFNSHGFRDVERSLEKPENTYRVAVFGDSYVEALQVDLAATFPALLERGLNDQSASQRFEVLSFGQSGFGTADSLMRYRNFGRQFSPDLVILAFLTGNDFRNNHRQLNYDQGAFYFYIDDSDRLVLDRSLFDEYERGLTLPKRLYQGIKRRSYLLSLISERVYAFNADRHKKKMARTTDTARADGPVDLGELSDLNVYAPQASERWREAFEITKRILLCFRDEVEADGSKFLLVSLSNSEQVHPEVGRARSQRYGLEFDYFRPDRFLDEFTQEAGIEYLQLAPEFLQRHLDTGEYLHGFDGDHDGHWNENGHRLAAESIYRFLAIRLKQFPQS